MLPFYRTEKNCWSIGGATQNSVKNKAQLKKSLDLYRNDKKKLDTMEIYFLGVHSVMKSDRNSPAVMSSCIT